MKAEAPSDLTHLSPEGAVRRHLDGRNYRVLRWVLAVVATTALISGLAASSASLWIQAIAWWIVLAMVIGIFLVRRRPWFAETAAPILVVFLATVCMVSVWTLPAPEPSIVFGGFLFPVALLLFRLRTVEFFALCMGLFASAAWFIFQPEVIEGTTQKAILISCSALTAVVTIALGSRWTRKAESGFLEAWRRVLERERERRHMRSEILGAREIQLSMLPADDPGIPWLDYSAVCLPASEVGGDYYDFFELGPEKLAIVIGDVAGHGVASGLVLSGVRSGLYLLRDQLDRPVQVLTRMNEMLRATSPSRMFVTLQIAILDWSQRRLTVASAGHPPLLHVSEGTVRAFGGKSLPLGTGLAAQYEQEQRTLNPGDCLVLYTDGIPELCNYHGVPLGEQNLIEETARAVKAGAARQVRDSILNGISFYKGDAEAQDDMTLVVLKMDSGLSLV